MLISITADTVIVWIAMLAVHLQTIIRDNARIVTTQLIGEEHHSTMLDLQIAYLATRRIVQENIMVVNALNAIIHAGGKMETVEMMG